MGRYVLRRLLQIVPVFIGTTFLIFALVFALLLLATSATLGALNLALLLLARPTAPTRRGLARPATLALALALVEMAALAGLRYGLEAALGRGGVGWGGVGWGGVG